MKRILVVDDDPSVSLTLTDILRDEGYLVEVAANGAEALRKMDASAPDAVLLDLMMPVMDGWSFARACRAHPIYQTIPFAVMSAARNAVEAARELGAQTCVPKPFDLSELLATVEQLSRGRDGNGRVDSCAGV